jgi:hypothetical protein
MRQIERNGPCFVDDIQVCNTMRGGKETGEVYVRNRRTHALSSGDFKPTAENIESVMKQCFEAGQQAKAAELRNVLGVA